MYFKLLEHDRSHDASPRFMPNPSRPLRTLGLKSLTQVL
jgi:hypothetical protein